MSLPFGVAKLTSPHLCLFTLHFFCNVKSAKRLVYVKDIWTFKDRKLGEAEKWNHIRLRAGPVFARMTLPRHEQQFAPCRTRGEVQLLWVLACGPGGRVSKALC